MAIAAAATAAVDPAVAKNARRVVVSATPLASAFAVQTTPNRIKPHTKAFIFPLLLIIFL
eukprot:scaffold32239_cov54-Attheya_sp.AAC.3